jgi:hypothetical protein
MTPAYGDYATDGNNLGSTSLAPSADGSPPDLAGKLYDRFPFAIAFLSRTPGPPPFSLKISTLAFQNAATIASHPDGCAQDRRHRTNVSSWRRAFRPL